MADKNICLGHPGKNVHDQVLLEGQKNLTRLGIIKDSLSKDHDHRGMDKKIHTGHPGKNAHYKSSLQKANIKNLTRTGAVSKTFNSLKLRLDGR
jgi:hypothetical protein